MSPEKLVHQANQIAAFFASQPRGDHAGLVADHFRDFWDPQMRTLLRRLAQDGRDDLSPIAVAAALQLGD